MAQRKIEIHVRAVSAGKAPAKRRQSATFITLPISGNPYLEIGPPNQRQTRTRHDSNVIEVS